MSSRVRLLVGGTVTYIGAIAAGYTYSLSTKKPGCSCGEVKLEDRERQELYSDVAKRYDNEIGMDEFFMGLNLLRWWNIRSLKGDILEVGCGTGRNFSYYNVPELKSITAIDSVPNMISVAHTKVPANQPKIALKVMNAHQLQFPDRSFDHVIDTFGLCSYDNPIQVLQEIARVCKPDSEILLIEHGRGSYDWINNLLDGNASQHAHKWGCIFNKDIEKLVRDAGLEITSISRFHFGTTYVIKAKPAKVNS